MENKTEETITNKPNSKNKIVWSILKVVLIAVIILALLFILKPILHSSKYEVTFEDTTKGILTLQVFTADTTGNELIKINDELLKEYKNNYPTVFIFYFDNKFYTTSFFDIFLKANLTPEEQQEILHNVAMYYYDKTAANNCLNKRLSVGWSILKCY